MMINGIRPPTRRTFLRSLLALPLGFYDLRFAPAAVPAPVPEPVPEPRSTMIGSFFVAGFQYCRGPELIPGMRTDEALTLAAEPDNPYDPLAVRIEYRGEKIGYVPRRGNYAISQLLRDGAGLQGRVTDVRADEDPWRMLRVEVTLVW